MDTVAPRWAPRLVAETWPSHALTNALAIHSPSGHTSLSTTFYLCGALMLSARRPPLAFAAPETSRGLRLRGNAQLL